MMPETPHPTAPSLTPPGRSLTAPQVACERLVATLEQGSSAAGSTARGDVVADRIQRPVVPLCVAQLRMRLAPALADLAAGRPPLDEPVHVVLLGATNSGKSTLVNLCLGRLAAGMNATARYSQYPVAYRAPALGDAWWRQRPTRFVNYRRYEGQHPPRRSDDDLAAGRYEPSVAILDPAGFEPLGPGLPPIASATASAVLWDTPDFSTQEAQVYMSTLWDTLALADVLVMAVTEENYADDRGLGLLSLVRPSVARVWLVANKVSPDDTNLLADISTKLNGPANGGRPAEVVALPRVRAADPQGRLAALANTPAAQAWRDRLAAEIADARRLKANSLAASLSFVETHINEAIAGLEALDRRSSQWRELVRRSAEDRLFAPYRSDYLEGHTYSEFDRTLLRLMELLRVPGIGHVVEAAGHVVRAPMRFVLGWIRSKTTAPAAAMPEEEVIHRLVHSWLDGLRGEAQVRAQASASVGATPAGADHARDLVRHFDDAAFTGKLQDPFVEAYTVYKDRLAAEIDRSAQAIYQALEARPVLLNSLRAANLAVNIGTTALVVKSGGLNWSDALLGPAVAGVMQLLVEAGFDQLLNTRRTALKSWQATEMESLFNQHFVEPVAGLLGGYQHGQLARQAREDLDLLATTLRASVSGPTGPHRRYGLVERPGDPL